MKTGINAWAFPSNLSVPQCLKLAKAGGFDCVELNISEDGYLTPEMSREEVERLRTAADNMSLELRSLSTGLFWTYPFTSNDPALVERAKEIVRKGLQVCKWIGADTMLVVPGAVTEDVPYDVAYDRALAALKELAKTAEDLGVSIGVENVWNKFLLSPLEMRDFIDAVGSKMVAAYFDAGNVLVSGYPQHWIRILGDRIKKVHVKDFLTGIGNITGFVNLLEGDVPWKEIRNALAEIGYDDIVTAEIGGYKTLPELGIKHAGESMKRIFKGAQA
jgi:L-ribulose-5-phosphate 3-epimerase